MSERPLSVVVVDDHLVFRRGLRQMLIEAGFDVLGEAGDGSEAVALVARTSPDVVVMDLNMPQMSGIEATRRVVEAGDNPAVLVLTVSVEQEDVLDALAAGAVGYLLKDAPAEEIARAVEAAAVGDAVLAPRVARRLVQRERARHDRDHAAPAADLSERELEILRLLAEGLSNEQIAARLYLSPRTVKNQISALLVKLGVENRVQAAVLAVRSGLA